MSISEKLAKPSDQTTEPEFVDEYEISRRFGPSVSKLRSDRHYGRGLPYIKIDRLVKYDLKKSREYYKRKTISHGE